MDTLRIFILIGFFVVIDGEENLSSPAPPLSPTYLISVSRVIQSGVPTTVSITILTESSVSVKSEIIHNKKILSQAQSIIEGGTTKAQVLPPIPENNSSDLSPYTLNVKGYNGLTLVFANSTTLKYRPRSVSILLQTDKPRYKPGQDVKIRALVLTPHGKPYNKQIDILIRDPNKNLIRQWLAVETVLGETDVEFQLTQNPPLGLWKIVASVNGVTQEKLFNVSHYVLPKFEVLLDAPRVIYIGEMLNYTVLAQYLYEKPVAGNLSVTYVQNFLTRKEEWKMINGTAELSIDLSSLFNIPNVNTYSKSFGYYVDIHAQVTELLTGVAYNSSVRVLIDMNKYHLEFQQYPSYLKPALNMSAQLKLSTYNKSPLTAKDQSQNVTLTVTQQLLSQWMFEGEEPAAVEAWGFFREAFNESRFSNSLEETLQLPVPADGIIPFQIQVSENATGLTIQASYEGVYGSLFMQRTYSSLSRSYIQLKSSGSPQIGKSLYMTVESNFPLNKFHYMVVSQGQVVAVGNLTSSNFSLSPDASWVPFATVLVYCVRPDGEIVHDNLDVSFTDILQNNVSVSWAKGQAEPAENVSLSVSVAEPGSLVGILVVDKASMDTDRSNDFTEKRVIEELTAYIKNMSLKEKLEMEYPYSVFMLNDITVLTNAGYIPGFYGGFVTAVDSSIYTTLQQAGQKPYQRHHFPETWLWFDTNISDSKTATFNLTVPDTMTSWVATAFVLSENLGLGLSAPAELRVFKNFFVSLNLPAYLVRGELLLLEVNLFNYMDLDLEVLVTVEKNSMFEFVSLTANSPDVRSVSVGKHNSSVALLSIKAIQLGQMSISVSATNQYASDAITQTILVKPEGREQSVTQTHFLEFNPLKTSLSKEMEFNFPSTAVPGSLRAQVTAVGDILGPSINGLDSLIQMPYGCGEQNMINFAPNVYVLQYLTRSGHVDGKLRDKALSYMVRGYEQELSYQRKDGSFSAFGDHDSSGSTWLSAFVLRCFLQARQFTFIDTTVLIKVTDWLQTQQQNDGSFKEPGRVIHTELQGGLDGPVSLTAYVLMALLEDVDRNLTSDSQINAAINYLTSKLSEGITSNYSLCLVTYALTLAKSSSANTALTELMKRAQIQNGIPTWSTGGSSVSVFWQPRSSDIEMVSYTLLSFNILGDMEKSLSLMKWLSQQRNHLGGYGSTQDTIIALQALSAFASMSNTGQMNLTITVRNQTATVASFKINQTNYMLYQIQEIKAEQRLQLNVSAVGVGFVLFQLTTFYNEETEGLSRRRRADTCEAFALNIDVMDNDLYNVDLKICFRLCENEMLNQTGMAILDVGLLTGFRLAQNGVPINDLVRKVETPSEHVILYLDSVTKAEVCVKVPTTVEYKVAGVHDAMVTIYDYYQPRRRKEETYSSEKRKNVSALSLFIDCLECIRNPTVVSATEKPVTSVPAGSDSSLYHQGLLKSLFLLLLITFYF